MGEVLLEAKSIGCSKGPGEPIFSEVNFTVNSGDVMVIQGKSGCGKSTLLKCMAHLSLYKGELLFKGRTPKTYGVPSFRTRVMYVPQRASLLPGTPREFMNIIATFGSYKAASSKPKGAKRAFSQEPIEIADAWGIDEELWDRPWSNLSGGEMQRIALSIAVGMRLAEVLLLDEPTSALDNDTALSVENFLKTELQEPETNLKAIVWITHSPEQGQRVGTRFMRLSAEGMHEEIDSVAFLPWDTPRRAKADVSRVPGHAGPPRGVPCARATPDSGERRRGDGRERRGRGASTAADARDGRRASAAARSN